MTEQEFWDAVQAKMPEGVHIQTWGNLDRKIWAGEAIASEATIEWGGQSYYVKDKAKLVCFYGQSLDVEKIVIQILCGLVEV